MHQSRWIALPLITLIALAAILIVLSATRPFVPASPIPVTSLTPIMRVKYPTAVPTSIPLVSGDMALDFNLNGLDGKTYILGNFQGKRVILNFWATWCIPCRVEMPLLQAAYERLKGSDLVVLAINDGEAEADVLRFVDQLKLTFPILLDPQTEVFRKYGVVGLPTTFFIDPTGLIKVKNLGMLTGDQDLQQFIDQLAALSKE